MRKTQRPDTWAIPTGWWLRESMWTFAKLSAPLLVGLFLPGFAAVAVIVLFLAPELAPRIWPRLSPWVAFGYGLGAMLLVWAVPFGDMRSLVTAQCGVDAAGVLFPALVATAVYGWVGYQAVVRNRPGLWLLGSLLVPVVHALATGLLLFEGVARQVPC